MGEQEIMKWRVEKDKTAWFTLKMEGAVRFSDFMNDILDRKDNYGKIQIQTDPGTKSMLTLTYEMGIVTWTSDDMIDRMGNYVVISGRAHGFPTHVDYYIMVKKE